MKRLANLFSANGPLQTLLNKLHRQEHITRIVQEHLPSPLNEYCTSAAYADGQLTLFAESPVWASRLRYQSNQLLYQLNRNGLDVRQIQIKVNITLPQSKQPTRKAQQISSTNAELLSATAGCEDDARLREALLRLSRHTKRMSGKND